MATTADAIILDGLLEHLSGLTLSTPLTVAYPNVDFSPPSTGYLRATHFPNETTQVTLGDTGQNRHTGFLQVSVMWPNGTGDIIPLDIAGEVIARFKRGTVISKGGLSIRIINPPTISPALQDDPFTQYPITIRYQADAANPS
jgi:hypothetical protein